MSDAAILGLFGLLGIAITQGVQMFLALRKMELEQKERDAQTALAREHTALELAALKRSLAAVHLRQDDLLRTADQNSRAIVNEIRKTNTSPLHPQATDYGQPTDVAKLRGR